MGQINTTCDVTNSSPTVTFPTGTDLSTIVVGSIVIVGSDTVVYYVLSIDDAADTITLTENYAGSTATTGSGTGTTVVVHNTFSSPDSVPYTEAGDIKNISIIKRSILKIQELFEKFPYFGNDFVPAKTNAAANLSAALLYGKNTGVTTFIETTSTTYVKVAEFTAQRSGGFYVYLIVQGMGDYDSYGRIYKNGIAHGTELAYTYTFQGSITSSETLYFTKGDLVQLYLKTENVATTMCSGYAYFYVLNEDYKRDSLIYRRDIP